MNVPIAHEKFKGRTARACQGVKEPKKLKNTLSTTRGRGTTLTVQKGGSVWYIYLFISIIYIFILFIYFIIIILFYFLKYRQR